MIVNRESDADFIVVGAGVMGLALALELARRNRSVLCLDRSVPGREASRATAGTLAVQNKPLGSVPLARRSLQLWRDYSRELEYDLEYEVRGGIRVAQTDRDVEKLFRTAAAQRAVGAPVEVLDDATRIFQVAPYLSRSVLAASYCPEDGMLNPLAAVRALLRACRREGVRFNLQAAATALRPHPGGTVRVEVEGRVFEAQTAIVAAGAWMPHLLATAGLRIPIAPRVQQVLVTDFDRPMFPHVVTHVQGNLTLKQQSRTGKVLVGGGWPGVLDEQMTSRRLSRDSVIKNARIAVAVVPSLGRARLLRAWTGLEGRSPDKLPVIGAMPGVPNLHVLGCASGGLTLAPACARLLAQTLTGEMPDLPLDPFSPARFQGSTAA